VASTFLAVERDEEDADLGGGDQLEDEGQESPSRGARDEDLLPFDTQDFLDEDLENVPSFVADVTHRSLRGDQGLDQRANAFGRGLSRPATHHQASGDPGFNALFGCATADFSEARVFQENPRTGAIMAVKVGAPKTSVGLLKLYNAEQNRLESIGHEHVKSLRKLLHWIMMQLVHYSDQPEAIVKFIEHDQTFRENCVLEGFSVCISSLNASWALALTELALTTTPVRATQRFFDSGGGGNRGGGGGGGRGARGDRGARQGGRGGYHGGGGRNPPPGNAAAVPCRDFARGNCTRPVCKFKH